MALPTCPIPAQLTSPQPLKELTQSAISSCERAAQKVPSSDTYTSCPTSLTSALKDFDNFVNQLGGEASQIDGCLVMANRAPNLWWKCSGYAEIGELEISPNNLTLVMNQWFKQDAIPFNNEVDRCADRNRVCPSTTKDLSEYKSFPDIDKVSDLKQFVFYLHGCLIGQDNIRRCAFVDLDAPTRISSRIVFQRVVQFATCGSNASVVLASPLNFPSKTIVHSTINTGNILPTVLPLRGSRNVTAEQLSVGTLVAIVLTCSLAVIGILVCIIFTIRRLRRPSHHAMRPANDNPILKKDRTSTSFNNDNVSDPENPPLTIGNSNAPLGSGPVASPNELDIPAKSNNSSPPKGSTGRSHMRILPMIKTNSEVMSTPVPNLNDLIKAYNAVFETLELHVMSKLSPEPPISLISSKLAGAAMSLIAQIHNPKSQWVKFPDGLDIRLKALLQLMAKYDPNSSLFSVHRGQNLDIQAPFVSVYKQLPSTNQSFARKIPSWESPFPIDTLIHESVFPGWMLSGGNVAITARVVVNAEEERRFSVH